MFGMGFMEIVFIAIIAILFLGPEKLPQTMVEIARFFKKVKNTIADTKDEIEKELQISELKAEMLSYKQKLDSVTEDVKQISKEASIEKELGDAVSSINESAKVVEKSASEPIRETITFPKKSTSTPSATENTHV
ncbi:MAG: hypothetical protein KU37_11990 [Sulfuricurvum sp. PC08-66]|nr:MAG: hypothetical protein KU37_11990 [Sulfuricurvum sp. PC08-66]